MVKMRAWKRWEVDMIGSESDQELTGNETPIYMYMYKLQTV
jgi:hypothetical protein